MSPVAVESVTVPPAPPTSVTPAMVSFTPWMSKVAPPATATVLLALSAVALCSVMVPTSTWAVPRKAGLAAFRLNVDAALF